MKYMQVKYIYIYIDEIHANIMHIQTQKHKAYTEAPAMQPSTSPRIAFQDFSIPTVAVSRLVGTDKFRAPLKTSDHHSTIVLRGLRR